MEYLNGYGPEFKTGDVVFLLHYNNQVKISETKIRCSRNLLYEFDGKEALIFKGEYIIDLFTFDERDPCLAYESHLFKTKLEAEEAGKWYPVEFECNTWDIAIGARYNEPEETSIEDSDLGICCATISEIRDYLYEVQKNKGIMEIDRLRIKELCELHDFEPEEDSELHKIFKTMGLV